MSKILGGRPMKPLDKCSFFDVVANINVYFWEDDFGREWMATNRWGWFRVRVNKKQE